MGDLRSLIERYLYQEYASIQIEKTILMTIRGHIWKRIKSLSFYFEEHRITEFNKLGNEDSRQVEELTNWVFTLFCRRKLKWQKETEEMTAFEYIVFRKNINPVYFLFSQHASAMKILLEQEIRKAPGIKKELLQTRDYIRRILNNQFRKFSRTRFGLWKWNEDEYENKLIAVERLVSIYVQNELWNSMFYEERIQLILEEADCPLELKQIATTYQRLEGLLFKEEHFPLILDKDGFEMDYLEIIESDGEINCKFPSPAEDLDHKLKMHKFEQFMGSLSKKEMTILKLKNYETLDQDKLRSDKEVALYFNKSHEAIRLWKNELFEKIRQSFPLYSDQKLFMRHLAEKLQIYKTKLFEVDK